jgi:hypothetical protein
MSITEEAKQQPAAPAPVSTGPSPGSPDKTGFKNRRLAVMAGLIVTIIVTAAVLLFNIGAPAGDEPTNNPDVEVEVEFDPGPPWQPNLSALEQLLNPDPTTDLETDFAGIPAPEWKPSLATRKTNPIIDPETDFAGMPAPQWEPDSGRLGTYLGPEQVAGIR